MNNLAELDKLLNHEVENIIRPRTSTKIESIIKSFPTTTTNTKNRTRWLH